MMRARETVSSSNDAACGSVSGMDCGRKNAVQHPFPVLSSGTGQLHQCTGIPIERHERQSFFQIKNKILLFN